MFQTAVIQAHEGRPWGVIGGLLALGVLLAGAYTLFL
jgi:hypothetical protein